MGQLLSGTGSPEAPPSSPASSRLRMKRSTTEKSKDKAVTEENKRRSSEWEAQVKSNQDFIRLRKQSLFSTDYDAGINGLKNLGNTCYMNSALQCLSNTRPLVDYMFGSDQWKTDLARNSKNPLGTGGVLANEFGKLVKLLWTPKPPRQQQYVTPTSFKKTVGKYRKQFAGTRQQDAQELLVFLLDGLHEDLNRVQEKPYIELPDADEGKSDEVLAAEQWGFHLRRNRSIIVDLFQGQLKSSLKCSSCNHLSVIFDPFQYLSLPFPSNTENQQFSLEELLEEFLKPELLTGNEQWYCPKCKTHVDAEKRFNLWKVPPILMIHLKRLGRRRKIDANVTIPMDFSMEGSMRGQQKESPNYSLYAVCRHYGGAYGGHYTAVAKNRNSNKWYEFNDATATPIEAEDVACNKAYVLFFEKKQLTESGYRRQSV